MKSILTRSLPFLLMTSAALATLPPDVKKSLNGYSLQENQAYSNNSGYTELLSGRDITSWWNQHISRTMLTAVIPNRLPPNSFEKSSGDWPEKIGEVVADTNLGEMTLTEALKDPRSGAKAMIIIHKGKVIFETYPGLKPTDNHLWASVAKPTAALLIEQLIDEGKIKDQDTVDMYLPDFANTALGEAKIIEILDMAPGTDTHDTPATRADSNSIATRYYRAEFGESYKGKVETVRDILRSSKRTGPAGERFEYSSGITQMLVFLAEAITGKTWSDAFDERVWSHVRAESALQVHLAPDGMAAAHGIVSSRLRDLARYGMLYTPYWPLVADKQVVSDAAMARIAKPYYSLETFMKGDGKRFSSYFGETPVGNSRQWDAVYADGGMFKGGLFGQGLYVKPDEGIVIAYYSTVHLTPLHRFFRPLSKALSNN